MKEEIEERRTGSMERVLVELGAVRQMMSEHNQKIDSLNTKVGIQNGRVTKLEMRNIVIQTIVTVVGTIMTLVLMPLAFILFQHWISTSK